MAFVYLVDFSLRGDHIMSLAQWDAASALCHLFIWIIDLSELINILWVIWVSSCALQCSRESRCLVKIHWASFAYCQNLMVRAFAGFLYQLRTISPYTKTFRVEASYFHLALPSAHACTIETTPAATSVKRFLVVCECTIVNVWACVEWKTLPSGYDKVTQGRNSLVRTGQASSSLSRCD